MKTKKTIFILAGILLFSIVLVNSNSTRKIPTPPAQSENSPAIQPLVSPAEKPAPLNPKNLGQIENKKTPTTGLNNNIGSRDRDLMGFTLIIDFGDSAEKISQSLDFQNGENLLDAMRKTNLKIKTKTYVGLGSMIENINGFKSGADGKYWQYWVNGKYSQVGASAYQIQPGDQVEWRFTPTP